MKISTCNALQRSFFDSGQTTPLAFRRAALHTLERALKAHEPKLLAALAADLRKSSHQAYTTELAPVAAEIRHALRHLPQWQRPQRRRAPAAAWPARAVVRREAFGVCLILGPWNYPLQLMLAPLVGAIAAGNTAVLKPSEYAPRTAAELAALFEAHFKPEYLAVVTGGQDAAEALLAERWDKIFFTGSTGVGRRIMAQAAAQLCPVTLELGGKCPCLVTAGVPLATTARRIVWGKFLNAGQTCVAPDTLWVERSIAEPLIAQMKQAIAEFYGKDPQRSPDYGRIIHHGHFSRLKALLQEGEVLHGGRCDESDLYIEPTLIRPRDPSSGMLAKEEIFGPILPIIVFDELSAMLTQLRAQPTPLAVYLFSTNKNHHELVRRLTRSGGLCVNDTISHILGLDLPFGGLGPSGMGRYRGRASFECFSFERSELKRSLAIDPPFRYPPLTLPLNVLKRLLKFLG